MHFSIDIIIIFMYVIKYNWEVLFTSFFYILMKEQIVVCPLLH